MIEESQASNAERNAGWVAGFESRQALIDEQESEIEKLKLLQEATLKQLVASVQKADRFRKAIEDEIGEHEAYVANTPCDAGNFDGGSPETCEHCGHARRVRELSELLGWSS